MVIKKIAIVGTICMCCLLLTSGTFYYFLREPIIRLGDTSLYPNDNNLLKDNPSIPAYVAAAFYIEESTYQTKYLEDANFASGIIDRIEIYRDVSSFSDVRNIDTEKSMESLLLPVKVEEGDRLLVVIILKDYWPDSLEEAMNTSGIDIYFNDYRINTK